MGALPRLPTALAALGLLACPAPPGPSPPPPPGEGGACAQFAQLSSGDHIEVSGDMGDGRDKQGGGCDIRAQLYGAITDVTVTGSWTGDVRCRRCNGWVFEGLTVDDGSLRMIGGDGWTIRDSTFDGGGRGVMAVVGTGSLDDDPNPTPTNWLIENIVARNAGCRPPDDPYPTHVRALYVIGYNGTPNRGVVRESLFQGEACGSTVKIGGTGNFGAGRFSPDAADDVLFVDNVIENVDLGDRRDGGSVALLLATNSDDVTVENNELHALDTAIVASGPWTGEDLLVVGNWIDAPRFMLGRIYVNPFGGEGFVTYLDPGPCPELGTCTDNQR